MKAKRQKRSAPSLSLRNKLIIEKEMPIYGQNDTRILKLTYTGNKILIKRPKLFPGLRDYCHITVIKYEAMECWIWYIYFLSTQRTFTV
jgi:hypothetical protein